MKKKTEKSYNDKVHTWGRLWGVTAFCVLIGVPVAICLYNNAWPKGEIVLKALLSVIPMYWSVSVIETVTYTPMLGAGGTYLAFITGNIVNLKMPCALNAMENAKVKANSDEGEVISTIAIGVSSIVTTVIIAVGVLAFAPFLSVITDEKSVFAPAFTYVLPALFGSLGAGYFRKHWKIAVFPILVGVVVLLFAPTTPAGTLLFPTLVASCAGAFAMLKLKWV